MSVAAADARPFSLSAVKGAASTAGPGTLGTASGQGNSPPGLQLPQLPASNPQQLTSTILQQVSSGDPIDRLLSSFDTSASGSTDPGILQPGTTLQGSAASGATAATEFAKSWADLTVDDSDMDTGDEDDDGPVPPVRARRPAPASVRAQVRAKSAPAPAARQRALGPSMYDLDSNTTAALVIAAMDRASANLARNSASRAASENVPGATASLP